MSGAALDALRRGSGLGRHHHDLIILCRERSSVPAAVFVLGDEACGKKRVIDLLCGAEPEGCSCCQLLSCFAVLLRLLPGPQVVATRPGMARSVILEGEGESIDGVCTTLVRVIRRCFPAPPYRVRWPTSWPCSGPCFTAPTFPTFVGLLVGLIAQTRRRTVCGMLTGAGLDQVWHHSRAPIVHQRPLVG
jgi:hypothetical protein